MHRCDITQPDFSHIWQVQPSHHSGGVGQGIAADVTILGGVRRFTGAHTVQDNYYDPLDIHIEKPFYTTPLNSMRRF